MQNKMLKVLPCVLPFQKFFGLKLQEYMDPIIGFDLCKFDNYITPDYEVSLEDTIIKRYGGEAADLIKTLIKA